MPHPWPFLGPTNLSQREIFNLKPNGTNIDNFYYNNDNYYNDHDMDLYDVLGAIYIR